MDPVSNDTQPLLGETTLTPPNSGASLLARTRKKVGEALAWGGISIGGGAVGGAGVMYFAGTAALSLPTGGAALLGAALPPAAVALYRRVVAEKREPSANSKELTNKESQIASILELAALSLITQDVSQLSDTQGNMALIQDLEKMCEFLCVSSPFKKNSNLKDFKQQVIAIEKDLLHEVISTLPTTSESEQTLKQALETIRDNFRNLLYRLTFIIFLEDPNNDEALQEIFADALRRSINEEGKTQIESLLFQLFISCLKSCKQENFQNLNEHQFFERFTLQLKNQADTSTSELTLPALEKCKQDQLFLFCLSKYIEAFYKKNIIAPKIDAARLDCSNLSADFDKIKQELEGLQKADPFDKLEEKSAYLSSNPLKALEERFTALKESYKDVQSQELESLWTAMALAIDDLRGKMNNLLNLEQMFKDQITKDFHPLTPLVKEIADYISRIFFLELAQRLQSESFENVWGRFLDKLGPYTQNPDSPLDSSGLHLLAWKTSHELNDSNWQAYAEGAVDGKTLQYFLGNEEPIRNGAIAVLRIEGETVTTLLQALAKIGSLESFKEHIISK